MSTADFNEEEAIGRFRLDYLYKADFGNGAGKYFNIVMEEDGGTTVEYDPTPQRRNRIKLTFTFIKEHNDIKEVVLKKFKHYKSGWREQMWGPADPFKLTPTSFQEIIAFMRLLSKLDLASIDERRIALQADGGGINEETAKKIRTILIQPDGQKLIDELIASGLITSRDIVNIGYRKKQLEVFRMLLSDVGYLNVYREEQQLRTTQPERIWQHFFEANEWIFGFGLDYRFLSILQREAHVGDEDLAGRDGAIGDYLLGSPNFTVMVELKTPETPIFGKAKNRANSWELSGELVSAVSQILEQKASWQVRAESNARGNFDAGGNLIKQRTIDPKCILVVGSGSQYSGTEKEKEVKLRTFELFRRDSRNIEIVTYDELYERATFLVHGRRKVDDAD